MQRAWSNSRFGQEVWDEAERAGLRVQRPILTYGTPADRTPTGTHPHRRRATPSRGLEYRQRHSAPTDGRVVEADGIAEPDRVAEVLTAVRKHPAVAGIAHSGYSLIDFAEPHLELEIAQLLRGWTLARACGGAQEKVLDPAAPTALLMGARAGLGLDPADVSYAVPTDASGSRLKRAVMRQVMRGVAAVSRPERVRVAAVTTGRLALALAALPPSDLHAAHVGVLPFPGLDRGSGTRFALRHRLALLTGYGPRRPGPGVAVRLPERLGLSFEPELDRALSMLVAALLSSVAPEQDRAVRALGGLIRTHSLQVLLLPNTAHGASWLLVAYARDRGLRVAVFDDSTYQLREVGHDGFVDVTRAGNDGAAGTMPTRDWPGAFDAAAFTDALRALAS